MKNESSVILDTFKPSVNPAQTSRRERCALIAYCKYLCSDIRGAKMSKSPRVKYWWKGSKCLSRVNRFNRLGLMTTLSGINSSPTRGTGDVLYYIRNASSDIAGVSSYNILWTGLYIAKQQQNGLTYMTQRENAQLGSETNDQYSAQCKAINLNLDVHYCHG